MLVVIFFLKDFNKFISKFKSRVYDFESTIPFTFPKKQFELFLSPLSISKTILKIQSKEI